MGWLRLDDAFGDHPKIAGLSDRAFRAHVEGLLYCARYLTDGLVPKAVAPSARITGELERAGLWTSSKRGWTIHDYLDWNPSKADAERKRRAKSMAGAIGAASRWQGRPQRHRNAPVPVPVPEQQNHEPAEPAPVEKVGKTRPRDELFEALAEVGGWDIAQLTRSSRGKLNDATKQLREIGATPEDVRRRAATYRRLHPTWDFTPNALVAHWPNLNGKAPARSSTATRSVEDMTPDEIEAMGR